MKKIISKHFPFAGYKNISFEREAYAKDDDVVYLDSRKPFAWVKYIKITQFHTRR